MYSAESDSNWLIVRETYDSSDTDYLDSDHPVGQRDDSGRPIGNQVWANRENLVYG